MTLLLKHDSSEPGLIDTDMDYRQDGREQTTPIPKKQTNKQQYNSSRVFFIKDWVKEDVCTKKSEKSHYTFKQIQWKMISNDEAKKTLKQNKFFFFMQQ